MKMTSATLKSILQKAIATGGPFDPAATYVGVATAITDRAGETAQSDVTEATGGLATRVLVTAWGTPSLLPDGRWCVDGPVCKFRPASSADAAIINNFFFNSASTAGTLKAFAPVAPAVSMVDENSSINVVPRLCIDQNGNYDASVVFVG